MSGEEGKPVKSNRRSGRSRTADEIREIVMRIARETSWGYARIYGERSRSSVVLGAGVIFQLVCAVRWPRT